MLAAITDPLTVALGGAKPLPNQASQWQGWSVTDLRTDGGWRRSSLVVNGDGLGADEAQEEKIYDRVGLLNAHEYAVLRVVDVTPETALVGQL